MSIRAAEPRVLFQMIGHLKVAVAFDPAQRSFGQTFREMAMGIPPSLGVAGEFPVLGRQR